MEGTNDASFSQVPRELLAVGECAPSLCPSCSQPAARCPRLAAHGPGRCVVFVLSDTRGLQDADASPSGAVQPFH